MHDLLIRGATVIDGLGHDPVRTDVAVEGGRIAAIGDIAGEAREIVDAGGLALMPGIIVPKPQLPITAVVTPSDGDGDKVRSQVTCAS
jgi:N-acyl-D-aspartate/D-glutamate deacylase